jgi:enoyl-CoA hydratase
VTDRTYITASVEGGTGSIHLDDAATRNALSPDMSLAIAAAVEQCLADGANAILLTAAPPVFCSGGSLDELAEPTHPLDDAYAGMQALLGAPVPTIAVVTGPAIGAGVNLPLACDVVLTTPEARFDPRFLDVGIHPGGGHLWLLRERLGAQGAAALALCGDALTGEEAAAAGLAWRCLPHETAARETAQRFATRIASRPPELVARTKVSLRTSAGLDLDRAAAVEREAQEWSMVQPFFAERVAALRARISGGSR